MGKRIILFSIAFIFTLFRMTGTTLDNKDKEGIFLLIWEHFHGLCFDPLIIAYVIPTYYVYFVGSKLDYIDKHELKNIGNLKVGTLLRALYKCKKNGEECSEHNDCCSNHCCIDLCEHFCCWKYKIFDLYFFPGVVMKYLKMYFKGSK